jgi:hypothetical protein
VQLPEFSVLQHSLVVTNLDGHVTILELLLEFAFHLPHQLLSPTEHPVHLQPEKSVLDLPPVLEARAFRLIPQV